MNKFLAALAVGCLLSTSVFADYTWDPTGSGSGTVGGGGAWSTTGNDWYNGTSDVVWPNTTAANAVFAGTGGVVIMNVALTAGSVTFASTGYTLSPSSSNFDNKFSSISLGANVNLNSFPTTPETTRALVLEVNGGAGTISGGSGATLTLAGDAANSLDVTNLEFYKSGGSAASTLTVSVPIIANESGTNIDRIYVSTSVANLAENVSITGGISLASTNTAIFAIGAVGAQNSITMNSVISGSGSTAEGSSVSLLGASTAISGVTILNGVNTYTGSSYIDGGSASVGNGVVRLGIDNALPDTAVLIGEEPSGVASTGYGALDLNGHQQSIASLDGLSTAAGIYNSTGSVTLTIDGNGFTSTYASKIGSTTAITNIANPNSNITIAKTGTGKQIFTASNLYSGGTTVSKGILESDNITGSGLGTGAVLVNGTGTLSGNGFIAPSGGNNVTIDNGGTLSPGLSATGAGTLTFNLSTGSKLAFNVGSTLALNLGATSENLVSFGIGPAGDFLSGSSNATLSLQLDMAGGFNYNSTYQVFTNVTTTGFTFANVTGYDTTDYTALLQLNGSEYDLSFEPASVPEPGTFSLLILTGVGFLFCFSGRFLKTFVCAQVA